MEMTVSECVFKYLEEQGVKHVFTIVGGGCMHLTDALGRSQIQPIYMHHEQALAMAAEAYARLTGRMAVVLVTSGPGGTNTLTGVLGNWMDSIPVMYISGNVSTDQVSGPFLRQLGDQEFNIVEAVKPMTKYALRCFGSNICNVISYAHKQAVTGRPGPVWIDIPLDIQKTKINYEKKTPTLDKDPFRLNKEILEKFQNSERPLCIVGNGVRLSNATSDVRDFLLDNNIPVLTGINGNDIFTADDENYYGRFGILGQEGSNKILQECDFLLTLGSRLNIRQIGYNFKDFARNAFKVHVDIDQEELDKPTLFTDIKVRADVGQFVSALSNHLSFDKDLSNWHRRCKELKSIEEYKEKSEDGQNSVYQFMQKLSQFNRREKLPYPIITSNGAANVVTMQTMQLNAGQRLITNTGCASMGYGLPAAIGAYFGSNHNIICIEGDGSLQMNIQELQTLKHHNMPMWLFVLNNGGYNSIKLTQSNFSNGNYNGCDKDSGVSFPNLEKIAKAYEISYLKISNEDVDKGFENHMEVLQKTGGPVLIEVELPTEKFLPKVSATMNEDGSFNPGKLDNMTRH